MNQIHNGVGECTPAGGQGEAAADPAPAAGAQQRAGGVDLGVVIQNPRDERTLAWLLQTVGEVAVREAVAQLSGQRRPYLSNITKVLGVTPLADLERADRQTAQAALAAIRAKLGG